MKLFESINEQSLEIVRDIRKEKFVLDDDAEVSSMIVVLKEK